MINQGEYEILKECGDEFKWVARDSGRNVWIYTKKPYKGVYSWGSSGDMRLLYWAGRDLFQCIQWNDEEPHLTAELIEEYEKNQACEIFNRQFESLCEESEEAEMKKDIEWAQKEIDGYLSCEGVDARNALMFAKGVISQLDEPEVLSQKWISEKSIDTHVDTVNGDIQVTFILDDLKNLIVPKQELPVIPRFVAHFIEEVKPDKSLRVAFEYIAQRKRDNYEDELAFWVEEGNSETLARAWLDGYKVAVEEPLYHALVKGHEFLADDLNHWNLDVASKEMFLSDRYVTSGLFSTKMSKSEWNKLGINDSNADFVKVEDVEE